jgi:hypothetical protein
MSAQRLAHFPQSTIIASAMGCTTTVPHDSPRDDRGKPDGSDLALQLLETFVVAIVVRLIQSLNLPAFVQESHP